MQSDPTQVTNNYFIDRSNLDSNITFVFNSGILQKKNKIIEIGCGIGSLTAFLTSKGYNVIGTDLSHENINHGKNKYPNCKFIQMPGDNLKFVMNSFDVALSFDVLEHIPDVQKHILEVKRILKPKGHYLLQTPNKLTNIPYSVIVKRSFTDYKNYHCSLQSYWSLKQLFIGAGFNISFSKIYVRTPFFRRKIKRVFGPLGNLMQYFPLEHFPIFLQTNFHAIASRI